MSSSLTIVSPTFYPEPLGTPHYVTDMARWFTCHGWEVQVVTAQPFYPTFTRHEGFGRQTRNDFVDGIPVYRLPTIVPKSGSPFRRAVTDINFLVQGALAATTNCLGSTQCVLSVSPGNPLVCRVGRAMARRYDTPHVTLVHDVMSGLAVGLGMLRTGLLRRAVRRLEQSSLNKADEINALTPQMADSIRNLGVRPVVRTLPLWATVTAPRFAIDRKADVQYSGNFGAKQGLQQLVALARELSRVRPSTTMIVRGAGSREGELRAALVGIPLEIHVEPPAPEDELASALSAAPIHIVPQETRTGTHVMPSKVINALAVGGTIIALAPKGSPLRDLAQSLETVRVHAVGDASAAANSIANVLDTCDLEANARLSCQYAAQHFSRDAILAPFASHLDGLIAGAGSRWISP